MCLDAIGSLLLAFSPIFNHAIPCELIETKRETRKKKHVEEEGGVAAADGDKGADEGERGRLGRIAVEEEERMRWVSPSMDLGAEKQD